MMNYRREIDGLRALAVLPVILFHAGFGLFSGGFVGVDVFFVISGYLITTLIVSEQREGRFALIRFYERRIRRILPALFLVMLVSLPFAWAWLLPGELKNFSRQLIAVCFFISNIIFSKQSGYFDTSSTLKPLVHTWSLGIEEQYYLLFPLFLILCVRFNIRRVPLWLALMALASLAASQWEVIHFPAQAFYLLHARGWELLLGALCAFYHLSPRHASPKAASCLSLLGIGFIVFAMLSYGDTTPFPGLAALLPTSGAALIILFARPTNMAGRLLAAKPLVGIGLISYSAYLWHQPLFAFARLSGAPMPNAPLMAALSLLSLLLAWASWKWVERPFRNPQCITRRPLFMLAAGMTIVFVAIGAAGDATKGYEKYFLTHRLNTQEQAAYALIQQHTGNHRPDFGGDDGACNFKSPTINKAFESRFTDCSKKYDKALVILGDSHGINIYNALFKAHEAPFLVGIVDGGCRASDLRIDCPYRNMLAFANAHKAHIKAIVYQQGGSYLLRDYLGRKESQETFEGGKPYSIDQPAIEKTASYLSQLAQSVPVVWLGSFVEAQYDFRDIRKAAVQGFFIRPRVIEIFGELYRHIASYVAANRPALHYISLVELLHITPDFLKAGDCLTYYDRDHFSECGEAIVGARIKQSGAL